MPFPLQPYYGKWSTSVHWLSVKHEFALEEDPPRVFLLRRSKEPKSRSLVDSCDSSVSPFFHLLTQSDHGARALCGHLPETFTLCSLGSFHLLSYYIPALALSPSSRSPQGRPLQFSFACFLPSESSLAHLAWEELGVIILMVSTALPICCL